MKIHDYRRKWFSTVTGLVVYKQSVDYVWTTTDNTWKSLPLTNVNVSLTWHVSPQKRLARKPGKWITFTCWRDFIRSTESKCNSFNCAIVERKLFCLGWEFSRYIVIARRDRSYPLMICLNIHFIKSSFHFKL